jgi:hypothetical protein
VTYENTAGPVRVSASAARLALTASAATLLCLGSLHVLSPEFDPSWRMVSEYALGRYGEVLSLMFLAWAVSSWALAAALWSQAKTATAKLGLLFLLVAGLGEAMAAFFDIRHDIGHGLAGLLGVGGFPIAAVLLSRNLRRDPNWKAAGRWLLGLAHLSWISVVLLFVAMAVMTFQFAAVNGGALPHHAPKRLPDGVIGLDGWANRLIVVSFCLWAFVVAREALKLSTRTVTIPNGS